MLWLAAALPLWTAYGDRGRFVGDSSLARSSYKCIGGARPGAQCVFHNVYLWNATLFYLHDGPPVQLPPLKLYHAPVPDDSDLLERNLWVVGPREAPWGRRPPTTAIARGVLWYWAKIGNMYHQIMENGQMLHSLLCEAFGFCTVPTQRTDVTLLSVREFWYDDRRADGTLHPHDEVLRCFTRSPVSDLENPEWEDELVVFRQLAAGLGMVCPTGAPCDPRAAHTGPRIRSMRALLEPYLTPQRIEGYRQRLHQCVGLGAHRQAEPYRPKVRLVDREREAHRSFLNARAVLPSVEEQLGLRVRHVRLEGRTLTQAARLMHETDILLAAHGAALAWALFLPHHAVVVEIVPHGGDWIYQDSYGWIIAGAYGRVTGYRHLHHALPHANHTVFRRDVVLADPRYQALSPAQRVALWEGGECPRGAPRGATIDVLAAHCSNAWALRGADWLLDHDQLVHSIAEAWWWVRTRGVVEEEEEGYEEGFEGWEEEGGEEEEDDV